MAKMVPAKEAARMVGLKYTTFLWAIRKKHIKAKRIGWAIFLTPKQIEKAKLYAHH